MANVNSLLNERLKKSSQSSKMTAMAKQSASGNLTSFAGIFTAIDLNEQEKNAVEAVLNSYAIDESHIGSDLQTLLSITAEIKAINNQAAILHGERIKKAQIVLKSYRDGAFTAWLMAAYGNRQTPYNFLHYYEFCESLPKSLRLQLDQMPRQAVYTLASRDAPLPKKQEIIQNYNGQTKAELLKLIRSTFPLTPKDQRHRSPTDSLIQNLSQISSSMPHLSFSKSQKQTILHLIETIREHLGV
ncbi:MAG: CT583 family protein [Parachlamydiaceae bacterium]|nr:CT583 family protein [Parachlamydiaceae bacterium]